jgi:hypothetical protein
MNICVPSAFRNTPLAPGRTVVLIKLTTISLPPIGVIVQRIAETRLPFTSGRHDNVAVSPSNIEAFDGAGLNTIAVASAKNKDAPKYRIGGDIV